MLFHRFARKPLDDGQSDVTGDGVKQHSVEQLLQALRFTSNSVGFMAQVKHMFMDEPELT